MLWAKKVGIIMLIQVILKWRWQGMIKVPAATFMPLSMFF